MLTAAGTMLEIISVISKENSIMASLACYTEMVQLKVYR